LSSFPTVAPKRVARVKRVLHKVSLVVCSPHVINATLWSCPSVGGNHGARCRQEWLVIRSHKATQSPQLVATLRAKWCGPWRCENGKKTAADGRARRRRRLDRPISSTARNRIVTLNAISYCTFRLLTGTVSAFNRGAEEKGAGELLPPIGCPYISMKTFLLNLTQNDKI